MRIKTTPASSPRNGSPRRYEIGRDLAVEVSLTWNPLDLQQDMLFGMAARKNKKRGFLFVSKVLGKHIPVQPQLSLLAGRALAELLAAPDGIPSDTLIRIGEALGRPGAGEADATELLRTLRPLDAARPTLFIGFAETATALGHSMFAAFRGDAYYLHTTREHILGRSVSIAFEEEHSHATSHRCYIDEPERVARAERVVLVDDELTTGKTALNIIGDLKRQYGIAEYVIASLLDWRSETDRARFSAFEAEQGVRIRTLALMSGRIEVAGQPIEGEDDESEASGFEAEDVQFRELDLSDSFSEAETGEGLPYMRFSGRFGLGAEAQKQLDGELARAAERCRSARAGERTLCMGTGEFMYIPMRIAAEMGGGVRYQSTTRSPIYPSEANAYAVRSAWSYEAPDHPGTVNYMYNVPSGRYDELFLFLERPFPLNEELRRTLRSLRIPVVHLVTCTRRRADHE
ncbi:phosphoribosyltransferase family protein [Cohnella hashimotonis]|uniref:Phosphoribosyltransferase family protein n=1 Tax=Cohnella hashimotonis TaxID=2826895 RepID=A0ABT6TEH2_9BACL|nr:phosphoribosyltransferase family protein [Cohnella hashimotonis]MDI4644723.1 phosphoribosyltransferase family protein [Cohnella hashimotonis]